MQGWFAFPVLLTPSQLSDLEAFLISVEHFVDEEKTSFTKRVEAAVVEAGLTGEEKDEYYSFHEDQFDRLDRAFPRIVYSSTLLSACSLFESGLVDLCKDLERDALLPQSVAWSDVKDKGVRRVARYLDANFGIAPARDHAWNDILGYFRVRDCIAHANGDVSLMQQAQQVELSRLMQQLPDLSIDSGRKLSLGAPFIRRSITCFAEFWRRLHVACRDNAQLGPRYWP
jgi:hypothetical protein